MKESEKLFIQKSFIHNDKTIKFYIDSKANAKDITERQNQIINKL